jgi:hypothetical protein
MASRQNPTPMFADKRVRFSPVETARPREALWHFDPLHRALLLYRFPKLL